MKPVKTYPAVAEGVISSRNHPLIKRVRSLHLRSERENTGLFYAEGLRFAAEALKAGAPLEMTLYCPGLLNDFGRSLVRRMERAGTTCYPVSAEVLHSVALNDEPQGIGLVANQRWDPLKAITPSSGLCWIALETIQSPGNLGTIIRTAEAVGAAGLILLDDSIDAYHPATVRASMGAMFAEKLRFVRTTPGRFLQWKQRHGCILVGTSPSASLLYTEVEYPGPVVLMMGGERKGLSSEQQEACDVMVRLPMTGRSDSLNVAVAAGVMLYEVLRQRSVMVP
jgi:TrmH family RNA methyltransferase